MYYYRVIYKGVYVIKMREYEEMGSHNLTTRKMKTMYLFSKSYANSSQPPGGTQDSRTNHRLGAKGFVCGSLFPLAPPTCDYC